MQWERCSLKSMKPVQWCIKSHWVCLSCDLALVACSKHTFMNFSFLLTIMSYKWIQLVSNNNNICSHNFYSFVCLENNSCSTTSMTNMILNALHIFNNNNHKMCESDLTASVTTKWSDLLGPSFFLRHGSAWSNVMARGQRHCMGE